MEHFFFLLLQKRWVRAYSETEDFHLRNLQELFFALCFQFWEKDKK